jgi:glycogen synthase
MTLRVLMTADTEGGVWIYALALCRALAGYNVSFRLVALGQPSPTQVAAAAAAPNVELVVRPGKLEWMPEPWEDLDRLEADLLAQADAGDCHLVHLNHLVHAHLPWRRPVLCAVHSCVFSWFEAVRGAAPPPLWGEYRRRVARSLRSADRVLAPSAFMLEQARRFYGPFRAGSVIANGSAAPLAEVDTHRGGILAAGRVWDAAKNLAPLADLAERLTAPLRIVGPLASADGQQAAAGGAVSGPLSQQALWAAMRRARLFVAPALYEPFGLGILEAARSGCALVLGDIPSLRESWDGVARFIDPRRPTSWLPALEELLADDGQRRFLAAAARERAAGLGLEPMAHGYLQLYRQVSGAPLHTPDPVGLPVKEAQ